MLTLNDIIHPEVRKLYPGGDAGVRLRAAPGPRGSAAHGLPGSQRRMCSFAEGLIEGAAEHYGEAATHPAPADMHEAGRRALSARDPFSGGA
ncbi:MAG: hypothetical protein WKF40_02900 [Thermoleophilaceae bacterium]